MLVNQSLFLMRISVSTFLLSLCLFGLPAVSWGQAYMQGQLTLSPVVGLRSPGAISTNVQTGTASVPFLMYVDYGVNPLLSLGPWIGFRYYDCTSCALETGGYFSAGMRFNGHILPIIEKITEQELLTNKWDPYVSLMGGYEWGVNIWRVPRAALGIRYYANPRVAFMGEVGSGIFSLFTLGCTFVMN